MKIYISGKITGIPIEEARQRFEDAELFLADCDMGEIVNPMKKGLPDSEPWIKHIMADIDLLIQCDAIYLMDNWSESQGAQIEYIIAKKLGMVIYHGFTIEANQNATDIIADVVEDATGFGKEYITGRSRKIRIFYARMMFCYQCAKYGMDAEEISELIGRTVNTVGYLLRQYETELKHNHSFRAKAVKVNDALENLIIQQKNEP